jgi:hypothetical protein
MRRTIIATGGLLLGLVLAAPSAVAADKATGLTFTTTILTSYGNTTGTISNFQLVQINDEAACWEWDLAANPIPYDGGVTLIQDPSPVHQRGGCFAIGAHLRSGQALYVDCFTARVYPGLVIFNGLPTRFVFSDSGSSIVIGTYFNMPVLTAPEKSKAAKGVCRLQEAMTDPKVTDQEFVALLNKLLAEFNGLV